MKKTLNYTIRASGLFAVVALSAQLAMAAGPASVNLRTASPFAILAGSTITSTGGGIVRGDVGLSPAGSQGIPPPQVFGTIYNGGAVALQAQNDLTDAYIDAAGRTVDRITMAGDIGGTTLPPGLYFTASSVGITGDLTLNGGPNDVWIFQIGSTLTTADGSPVVPASRVILTGGARAENVYWQVGSSATLGSYSVFAGTIMAQASITLKIGSAVEGRALARTSAVTFDGEFIVLPAVTTAILAPTTGYSYFTTSVVTVVVSATSSIGITSVQVVAVGYLGTNFVGSTTNTPYQIVWNNPLAGEYVLTATAWDTQGNATTSAPVTVSGMAPIWAGAVDLGGGWRWLPRFGYFEEDGNNWIWHEQHGWMYVLGNSRSNLYFYTEDMGWLWSSAAAYPRMFRLGDSAWLRYQLGSDNPRWFYNQKTRLWEAH